MKKNVLQYMEFAALYKGNFINSIMYLEKKINENGSEMVYLFPAETRDREWIKDLVKENKKVYFLSDNILKSIFIARRIIKENNIGIIHLHFADYKRYITLKIASFLSNKVDFISHFHNHYESKSNKIVEKILRSAKKSSYYIGVGYSVAMGLAKAGFEKGKVKFIPNAIDFSRLDSYESLDKSKMGIEGKKVVLMFGYPYKRKGVDLVIDAMSTIAEKDNIVLLISLASNVKNEVEQNIIAQLGSMPSWIKLIEARNDIATYYNLADVFMSAGREEGLCYSVIEAAYCRPLINVSNIPGNVLDIPCNFLHDVTDIDKIRENLLKALYLDEDTKKKYLEIQKEFVLDNYSLDKWAEEIINLYKRLI